MRERSYLDLILIALTCLVLVFSVSMVSIPVGEVEAHTGKGHKIHSIEYESVYYDPNDSSRQRGVWVALISLHPSLKAFPILQQLLGYLGLGTAYTDMIKAEKKKADTKYYIKRSVYKANKTTLNYWGYYEINVYNTDTHEWHYGKHKVIGKTAY